jgi:hypothetical protein
MKKKTTVLATEDDFRVDLTFHNVSARAYGSVFVLVLD